MKKIVFWLMLLTGLISRANAQSVIRDSIYSAALQEMRPIEIVLPKGYSIQQKYEVVYATDGDWNTKIAADIQQFLQIQFMPPVIIVGIYNTYKGGITQRTRDFTPTHMGGGGLEDGGADRFLSFISGELMPRVNSRYRSNGKNIFFGGSLGGTLGMYTFIKRPAMFDAYLLADPALWWGGSYLQQLAAASLDTLLSSPKILLITARPPTIGAQGIASMESILRSKPATGLRYELLKYDNETHNSMVFRTMYDGLKLIYNGYSKEPLELRPAAGLVAPGKPYRVKCIGETFTGLRYTTDASGPNRTSPLVDSGVIRLSGPAELSVKAFCNLDAYSQTNTGSFRLSKPWTGETKPGNGIPGGLMFSYYEGSWDQFPDFSKLRPVRSGYADKNFRTDNLPR
jgi:predicted alpha/beta superfamily hydrolase